MSRLLTVALCAGWAFVVAGGISIPANAATCTTINSISVTTNGGDTASCSQASNSGNINGNPMTDDWMLTHPGFVFLDASDNGSGLADGALTISTTPGGAWSINAALVGGYTNFALGIKLGNFNPDWAVFLLGGNWNLGGVWAKSAATMGAGFSHAILYAQVAPVPVPPALLLFLSGVLGLVGLGIRRRRAMASVA